MDQASTLVRTTVRSFPPSSSPYCPLILDAVLTHSALTMEDLTTLLNNNAKDLRPVLHYLLASRLIASHKRDESAYGAQKSVKREYYYVHFHSAIDAVKYRVWDLQRRVKAMYEHTDREKADQEQWVCRRCGSRYSDFDMPRIQMVCEKCGNMVEAVHAGKEKDDPALMAGHEKLAKLSDELKKIVDLLQRIDNLEVPENTFESAFERRKEVAGSASQKYVAAQGNSALGKGLKTAKAGAGGIEQTDAKNLAVSFTAGEDMSKEEQEKAQKEKEEKKKQNELPSWIAQSTVTGIGNGEPVKTSISNNAETLGDEKASAVDGEAEAQRKKDDDTAAMWEQYLESMEKEKKEKERQEEEEDEDDDDDDDDEDDEGEDEEFEEALTPNPPLPPPSPSQPLTNGDSPRKRKLEDSAENDLATTNGNSNGTEKRVKFDEQPTPAVNGEAVKAEDGTSDEDDAEDAFEDVI
ncbi:MAG: hypothetical protein Q9227_004983 [Pyrenula ochraceoflavens]